MESFIKDCAKDIYSYDKIDCFYNRIDLNININKLPKHLLDELLKGEEVDNKFIHIYLFHCLKDEDKEYDVFLTCQYNEDLKIFNELYFDKLSDEDLKYVKELFNKEENRKER